MWEWKIGLADKAIAETLSHQMTGTWVRKMWSSLNKVRSHDNLAIVVANAWYSTSSEERDTVLYFLADQEIGLGPGNTSNLVVERRFLGSPVQSASENTVRVKGPGVNEIPKCKVPLI